MDSALTRLESVLGNMEKAAAPVRSCEERLDDLVARMEKLFGARGSFAARRILGPPRIELQSLGHSKDHKWVVENQVGQKDIVVKATSLKQSLHIFGCLDCVIRVEGKLNKILVDQSTKTAVLVQDVVGSFEVLNCNSVEIRIEGTASALAVQHTMGCQLFLGKGAIGAEIMTARSSSINVQALEVAESDDLKEYGIPDQFVTTFVDGKFVTTPVSC